MVEEPHKKIGLSKDTIVSTCISASQLKIDNLVLIVIDTGKAGLFLASVAKSTSLKEV